jgi:heme-degrading monooxygenase HmoA
MAKVTTINTLVVKPGQIDAYIGMQSEFAAAMASGPTGLMGGRLYKGVDGSTVVLVSQFESIEAQSALMRSAEFSAHLAKLRELVESSSPAVYEEAYTYGKFE